MAYNEDNEVFRCICGCFMEVTSYTGENSEERYEACCNRCGHKESGAY